MDTSLSLTGIALAVAIVVINVTIGLLVVLRNNKLLSNQLFLTFTIFLSIWAASSVISDSAKTLVLSRVTAQMAYAASFIGLSIIWLFSAEFAHKKWISTKRVVAVSVVVIIVSVLYGTPLVYTLETLQTEQTGILYYPYLLSMIVLFILTASNLNRVVRHGLPKEKVQARIMLFGTGFMIVGALITNAILPKVTEINADTLTKIGPFFTVAFTGSTAFAIIKHKLFDVRAVVARAATYLLTTSLLVTAYVSMAFLAKKILFPGIQVTGQQLLSNIILSVLLVLGYPYVKRVFDRLTNKLFFRDAYDTQVLLDNLNKTLVSNIQIEKLLNQIASIIETNLKSSFCSFYISDTGYFNSRMLGDHENVLTAVQIEAVKRILPKLSSKVVYVEDIDVTNEKEVELAHLLKDNGIELLVRLSNDIGKNTIGTGYLLLGPKRSGNLYSKQDLRVLEIIANELVIAIENTLRYEEIEQFSLTLQKKVNEATKELRKSNEKLKALDEAKDEFISMASHQLRTPLTSVKGYLSMLAEGDAGKLNATQKQFIDQAFVSSQRMVYLIADLLNVSRLKTGKFIIESAPTYLPDVVESEIAQLHETVKSRGLTMTFSKPLEFSTLNLDETKIRQVVMNFTDNAIYYTPSGGDIELKLVDTPTSVEFTVTDTGLGVPKTDQPHLFTKFYRAGNARKARPDGTGLGLFMAKKVIVAQGGSLIFKSTENKGSTFGFRFPKEKLLVK